MVNLLEYDQDETDPVDRILRQYGLGHQRRSRASLLPEEGDSLLQHLAHGGMSALQAVGSLLDIGGPTVRQGISGLFGLDAQAEDPEYGLTGWDLTKAMGLEGEEGLDWTDIPSFAVDMATSPLSWLNPFTGTTKAAQVAAKAGLTKNIGRGALARAAKDPAAWGAVAESTKGARVGSRAARGYSTLRMLLDDIQDPIAKKASEIAAQGHAAKLGTTLDDLLDESLGAMGSFGLPFTKGIQLGTDWSNPLTRAWGNTLDKIGDAARWGNIWGSEKIVPGGFSPGRQLASMFDPSVGGRPGVEGQLAAADKFSRLDDLNRPAREHEAAMLRRQQELMDAGIDKDTLIDYYYTLRERKPGLPSVPITEEVLADLRAKPPEIQQQIQEWVDLAGKAERQAYDREAAYGLSTPMLEDDWRNHAYRQMVGFQKDKPGFPRGNALFNTDAEYLSKVENILRDIPGGTTTLHRMLQNPLLTTAGKLTPEESAKLIRQMYLDQRLQRPFRGLAKDELARERQKWQWANNGSDEGFEEWIAQNGPEISVRNQAKALADWLPTRSPEAGFSIMDPGLASGKYARQAAAREASAEATYDAIQRGVPRAQAMDQAETVAAKELFDRAGINVESNQTVAQLAKRLPDMTKDTIAAALKQGTLRIPKAMADDALAIVKGFTGSDTTGPFRELFDAVQGLWKTVVTARPNFQPRNFLSGQVQNVINGAWDGGSFREAWGIIHSGQPIPGMAQWPGLQAELVARGMNVTDQDAFKLFQELVYRNQLIGGAVNQGAEEAVDVASDLGRSMPGQRPWQWGEQVTGPFTSPEASWNPLNRENFPAYKLNQNLGWATESMNRLVPFINKLKGGMTADAAADAVKLIQVDYSPAAFTGFEKAWMKRLMPFYSFQKGMIKYLVNELYQHPAGPLAQTIRASADLTEGGQVMPDYVTQGGAIPLGLNAEGGPRVLAGFSLMHEDPLQLLGVPAKWLTGESGLGDVGQEMGLEVLSRTNPFIKAPLEATTGVSFWQRGPGGPRDLQDQDPVLGRTISNLTGQKEAAELPRWLESLASNFAGPLPTIARQATDPRKRSDMFAGTPGMEWTGSLPGLPFWARQLLGAQIVDVSPRSQDTIVRELATKALMDTGFGKTFERAYVPKDVRAELGPGASMEIDQLQALLSELAMRAKARAQGQQAPALGTGAFVR